MKFYKGEQLNTKELIKRIGISHGTWDNKRKDILLALSNSCEYEVIYKGRAIIYHFLKDGEYSYERKSQKSSVAAQKRDAAFESAIIETLTDQPLNTAANVKRIIVDDWPEVTNLGYADSTVYEYTRVRMRKWFGKDKYDNGSFEDMKDLKERKGYIKDKVWCYLDSENNVYIPLSKEQVKEFVHMLIKNLKDIEQKEINLLADLDAGTITKEEYKEISVDLRYDKYISAKSSFRDKYGYFPINVPEYIVWRRESIKEDKSQLK